MLPVFRHPGWEELLVPGGFGGEPSSAPVTGGGLRHLLANVPQPGASLSSSTGLPHQEGLTRDELSRAEESAFLKRSRSSLEESKRPLKLQQRACTAASRAASSNRRSPQGSKQLLNSRRSFKGAIDRSVRRSSRQGRRRCSALEDLSAKEQAAAQLEQLSGRQQATAQLGNLGMPPRASVTTAAPSSVGELTPGRNCQEVGVVSAGRRRLVVNSFD